MIISEYTDDVKIEKGVPIATDNLENLTLNPVARCDTLASNSKCSKNQNKKILEINQKNHSTSLQF